MKLNEAIDLNRMKDRAARNAKRAARLKRRSSLERSSVEISISIAKAELKRAFGNRSLTPDDYDRIMQMIDRRINRRKIDSHARKLGVDSTNVNHSEVWEYRKMFYDDLLGDIEKNSESSLHESSIFESNRTTLSDIATISKGMRDADFWIVRRGSESQLGKPTKEFNPEHIGVKVTRTDVVIPQFLYYSMEHLYNQGIWRQMATGSLELKNIRIEDVKRIPIG